MPRFWKRAAPTRWMLTHKLLNSIGGVLTLGGTTVAIIVMAMDGDDSHFSSGHKTIGLLMTLLVVAQIANGFLRPPKGTAARPPTRRVVWRWAHAFIGAILVLLAILQLVTGVQLSKDITGHGLGGLYAMYGVTIGVAVVVGIVGAVLTRKVPVEYTNEKGIEQTSATSPSPQPIMASIQVASMQQVPADGIKVGPCGTKNKATDTFCGGCGSNLDAVPVTVP